MRFRRIAVWIGALAALATAGRVQAAEDWLHLKYDAGRSGNAADRSVSLPLGLVGSVALTDAVFTAPVVADGLVYVVDGSGVAFCIDPGEGGSPKIRWRFVSEGGGRNCNNRSSPAVAGRYLHFGTTAGWYYVLDRASGKPVRKIFCGEPIMSAPAVGPKGVYVATVGSCVYALAPDGGVRWKWDYAKERLGFKGDKWKSADWLKRNGKRVTWRDRFTLWGDIAVWEDTVVLPAGGEIVWIKDKGSEPQVLSYGHVPSYKGSERPSFFGLAVGSDGSVYVQWHRRDNTGRVEIFRLVGGVVKSKSVPGTLSRNDMGTLMGFASVSVRGRALYRTRPQEGYALCRHDLVSGEVESLGGFPSIAPPVLLSKHAVFGGLNGRLYVVPLEGTGKVWSFATAFGKAITAPVAVSDGRIYFGCEDGYLYILGPGGRARLPEKDLELWRIRSPLSAKRADRRFDWFTNFGDWGNTNATRQGIKPPCKVLWIRQYAGTFKHLPVCGGGRMYTHTAEGQVLALEQETGRLLWRRYFPGVFVCYTAPLYVDDFLLVPQAGLEKSRLRCFDADTGKLLWEAPFSGSPSWSRQQPPVVWKNLAFYMFGTGKYAPKGTGIYVMRMSEGQAARATENGTVSWLYSHDNPRYPKGHRPIVRAYDLHTGSIVWERDFSKYGTGGDDAGLCLMNDKLYYSVFFGYAARRRGKAAPTGLTAALDPATGAVLWLTTRYSVTAGCTITGRDGRLYLGGYNPPNEKTEDRFVWCLDGATGRLVWRSEPLVKAINVVTVGRDFVFAYAYGGRAYLLDKANGRVLTQADLGYACTRFSLAEPFLVGCNLDLIDPTSNWKLVSTGPPIDGRECVGGTASNGRLYYTAQASGFQLCEVCGEEAETLRAAWEK